MKTKLLFFFLFLSVSSYAQTDSVWLKKNIKSGMDSVSLSFEKKDWKTFAGLMHPSLIEMFGDQERFVTFIDEQMKTLLKEAEVNSMGSGNILQLINFNNQWQCVVESYLQMTVDSMIVSTVSSNVGVSFDNGLSWKFLRVTNGNETKVKELIKGLSPEIQIPYNKTELGVTLKELLKIYKPVYPPKQD